MEGSGFLVCFFTSTQDECSDEERQVTVLQLKRFELRKEMKLVLHHVTEGLAEALDELSGYEDPAPGRQDAVLVGEVTQTDHVHLEGAVLQHGDLIARLQLPEARDALGELCEFTHGLGHEVLHAVEQGQLQIGGRNQS